MSEARANSSWFSGRSSAGAYILGFLAGLLVAVLVVVAVLMWLGTDGFEQAVSAPEKVEAKPVDYDLALARGYFTIVSHEHSPAYNGSDVSYLQDGQTTTNSVLSACNLERDGRWVVAKGYDASSGNYYRAYDYSADGNCQANFTGHNLEWHKIKEEGGEYGGTSYH